MAARNRAAGGRLSYAQIEQLWLDNGGQRNLAPVMAAISIAESGGRPDAMNTNAGTGDYSVGLWQINYFGNLAPARTARYGSPAELLRDVNRQAKAAIDLAAGGAGLHNWSTYNSGAYRAYMGGQNFSAGRGPRPGANTDGSVGAWLGSIGHDVAAPFEAIGSVVDFLKAAAWLVDPRNWLRLVEALFGFVIALVGLYYLGNIAGGPGGAALSDAATLVPGVGPAAKAVRTVAKGEQKRRKANKPRVPAAAKRGEQVTTAKVTKSTAADKRAARRIEREREHAKYEERRRLDRKYGDVPF